MAGQRRFIAGAVCPRCQQMDKLYIETDPAIATCAACGFVMDQANEPPVEKPSAKDEAVTLVNFKTKK